MNSWVKAMGLAVYSVSVIASGLVRFLFAEGGSTGLIFGLVMGAIGLVGSGLIVFKWPVAGSLVCGAVILLVGGWFCYESFIKKGIEQAELRQLIIIGLSGLASAWVLLPTRPETLNASNVD